MGDLKINNRHLRDKCDNNHQTCIKCNIRASAARIRVSCNVQDSCRTYGKNHRHSTQETFCLVTQKTVQNPALSLQHYRARQSQRTQSTSVSDGAADLATGSRDARTDRSTVALESHPQQGRLEISNLSGTADLVIESEPAVRG